MRKEDIIRIVSRKTLKTQTETGAMLDAVFQAIADALTSGEKVQIADFGTFEVKARAPRTGRNPKKNLPVPIPARRAPVFRAATVLKNAVEHSEYN